MTKNSEINAPDEARCALWESLKALVQFEGDPAEFEKVLSAEPKAIHQIMEHLKHVGDESNIDLKHGHKAVIVSWNENEQPVLMWNDEVSENFIENFAQNYEEEHAASSTGARKRSLSDLAFSKFAKGERPRYMCLDGSAD